MKKIIEVTNLRKSYGDVTAVRDLSFYVEQGKLFSFLGPNGAGKSTTINILCTFLDYDGGTCAVDGMDLRQNAGAVRSAIGVVFQEGVLDDLLTVRENLWARAGLYTPDRATIKNAVYQATQAAELTEFLDRPYGRLSGGQRRRADIARALIHQPKILFLDEPTTGLDPQTRKNIWSTIRKLQSEQGMTVFLTTHYMEEAADSDYVIVVDHGEIAAKGTPSELKTRFSSDTLHIYPSDEAGLRQKLALLGLKYSVFSGSYQVKLAETKEAIPILDHCQNCIGGFQVLQGTMDDAFLGITGKELRV